MTAYSYFRADGQSLLIVQTVDDAKKEIEQFNDQLCVKYGASEYFDYGSGSFVFNKSAKAPEGWEIKDHSSCFTAKPAQGSADAFYIANVNGLKQRAQDRSNLGVMFGCGNFPEKKLPEGKYHGAFVCDGDVVGASTAGRIRDTTTMCFGSNSPITVGFTQLDAMQLAGTWYIRVPNDANGKPYFTPPDAALVSFTDMMIADRKECDIRNPPYKRPIGVP